MESHYKVKVVVAAEHMVLPSRATTITLGTAVMHPTITNMFTS